MSSLEDNKVQLERKLFLMRGKALRSILIENT